MINKKNTDNINTFKENSFTEVLYRDIKITVVYNNRGKQR